MPGAVAGARERPQPSLAGGQTTSYRLLYSFNGGPDDGKWAAGPLVEDGGVIYGALQSAGPAHRGAIFAVDASGSERIVHAFAGRPGDGSVPIGTDVARRHAVRHDASRRHERRRNRFQPQSVGDPNASFTISRAGVLTDRRR
ncbi:MAG TPA: hypothetical protein VGF86_16295 [Candidatus Tumulicola sp.]|jgi:hypothetical protein